jgi:putative membrane protein
MNIAQSPTRQKFPLSRKKIFKKTISSVLVWFFLLAICDAIFIFGATAGDTSGWPSVFKTLFISVLVLAFISFLTYLYQRWYFEVYFYDLTDKYIIIKKGPITPHEITIPYERVQDVYVDQDLWDRILGIYDVHLSSATATSGMEAHIDGVKKQAADGLRELLLSTIHEKLNKRQNVPNTQTNI